MSGAGAGAGANPFAGHSFEEVKDSKALWPKNSLAVRSFYDHFCQPKLDAIAELAWLEEYLSGPGHQDICIGCNTLEDFINLKWACEAIKVSASTIEKLRAAMLRHLETHHEIIITPRDWHINTPIALYVDLFSKFTEESINRSAGLLLPLIMNDAAADLIHALRIHSLDDLNRVLKTYQDAFGPEAKAQLAEALFHSLSARPTMVDSCFADYFKFKEIFMDVVPETPGARLFLEDLVKKTSHLNSIFLLSFFPSAYALEQWKRLLVNPAAPSFGPIQKILDTWVHSEEFINSVSFCFDRDQFSKFQEQLGELPGAMGWLLSFIRELDNHRLTLNLEDLGHLMRTASFAEDLRPDLFEIFKKIAQQHLEKLGRPTSEWSHQVFNSQLFRVLYLFATDFSALEGAAVQLASEVLGPHIDKISIFCQQEANCAYLSTCLRQNFEQNFEALRLIQNALLEEVPKETLGKRIRQEEEGQAAQRWSENRQAWYGAVARFQSQGRPTYAPGAGAIVFAPTAGAGSATAPASASAGEPGAGAGAGAGSHKAVKPGFWDRFTDLFK